MRKKSTSVWLFRFLYHQITHLLTASAVVAVFWAITGQGPSLAANLIEIEQPIVEFAGVQS